MRARQGTVRLDVLAVLGGPARECAAVGQRRPPIAHDRRCGHARGELAGCDPREIHHHRLPLGRTFPAAPEDQQAALGLFGHLVGLSLLARGDQRDRLAQLGARRHEMVRLGRAPVRCARRSYAQIKLVLGAVAAAPAAHHRPHHPAGAHAGHARNRAGAHVIARDRAARRLLGHDRQGNGTYASDTGPGGNQANRLHDGGSLEDRRQQEYTRLDRLGIGKLHHDPRAHHGRRRSRRLHAAAPMPPPRCLRPDASAHAAVHAACPLPARPRLG